MSWKTSTRGEHGDGEAFFVVAEREMLIPPFGNADRVQLATTWMNEEWYNDRIRSSSDPNWVCTLHRPPLLEKRILTPPVGTPD